MGCYDEMRGPNGVSGNLLEVLMGSILVSLIAKGSCIPVDRFQGLEGTIISRSISGPLPAHLTYGLLLLPW